MFNNYFYLRRSVNELNTILQDSLITEIYSQEKNHLFLKIPANETPDRHLLISVDPLQPYMLLRNKHSRAKKNLIHKFSENLPLRLNTISMSESDRIIKFNLDKGESHKIKLLGTFSRDENNRIRFIKDPDWIIDPEIFGLSELDLIELEDEKEETASAFDRTPTSENDESIYPSSTGRIERKPVNKWRIIWLVVASLVVVLAVILFIPVGEDGGGIKIGKDGIVIQNSTVKPESRDTDSVGQKEAMPAQNMQQISPEETEQAVKSDKQEETISVEHRYFTIAGSFQHMQYATELQKKLESQGFISEIILTDTRMYRVSVKSYATKQEALEDLPRLKETPGLEGAWVWKK